MDRRLVGLVAAGGIAVGAAAALASTGGGDDTPSAATTTTSTTPATTLDTAAPEVPVETTVGDERRPSGSIFAELVVDRFEARDIDAGAACDVTNTGVQRVLGDYGAVFLARGVIPPTRCIYADDAETAEFQASLDQASSTVGGIEVTLQRPALDAFEAAAAEAAASGVRISPRGTLGSARTFTKSRELWLSRVEPGLARYVGSGQVTAERAGEIRAMANIDQVEAILELESRGLLFGRNQAGSIMSSVAPPGASQHHALLAQDVAEFGSPTVHEILADHGFFQTVVDDEPHFTYLGVAEADLPSLGLRLVEAGPHRYWVPDV